MSANPSQPSPVPASNGGGERSGCGGDRDISAWRARIDEIDPQLVAMLNERLACALEIGAIKRARQLPVFDPTRESAVLDRLCSGNPGPLPNEGLRRIYEVLFAESRRLQEGR